ncbi:MAG: hypothetical protein CVU16_08220 [Betaproteobacteria bacterium HGW-Betaproteobacteria-10]|nr:MAG: hypothetical protein CVU16_08220 [Betaproteobacteria bacterium HGW-Betaproteobacteria-10]
MQSNSQSIGHVLVVDDSPFLIESMRLALQDDFEIAALESGEACLDLLKTAPESFDLILLDIEMDGIDGFETCRRLRLESTVPVIFVSSHDELPDLIKAFDSGGDDFVVKPFDPAVLLRKVQRMVAHQAAKKKLAAEKKTLESIANGFLRNISETGVLLEFVRGNLGLTSYEALAERLLEATNRYGVSCHVQVRHAGGCLTRTPAGKASPLEESVLEKSAMMGRVFQFSRRLVVNYSTVSTLVIDLPDDDIEQGKIRNDIAILAETAEAISETIAMRQESANRAEALQAAVSETADAVDSLRELLRIQQADAHQHLSCMIDEVEKAYINLGLTDLQEHRVSNIVREGTENTLLLFDIGGKLDAQFSLIHDALRPQGSAAAQSEIW